MAHRRRRRNGMRQPWMRIPRQRNRRIKRRRMPRSRQLPCLRLRRRCQVQEDSSFPLHHRRHRRQPPVGSSLYCQDRSLTAQNLLCLPSVGSRFRLPVPAVLRNPVRLLDSSPRCRRVKTLRPSLRPLRGSALVKRPRRRTLRLPLLLPLQVFPRCHSRHSAQQLPLQAATPRTRPRSDRRVVRVYSLRP